MSRRNSRTPIMILICAVMFLSATTQGATQDPKNAIVVIVDSSGTFGGRISEALAQVQALLESLASRHTDRWDDEADEIALVSLDAMPKVLWSGNVQSLKQDPQSWAALLAGRTDYASCSDVTRAFRLAARELSTANPQDHRYLYVFSDLVHDPPIGTAKGKWTCREARPPVPAPPDFPWSELKGVNVCAYWLPSEQLLTWQAEIERHELEATFVLYSESESTGVTVAAPGVAQPSHEELAARSATTRARSKAIASRMLSIAALAFMGAILAAVAISTISRIRQPKPTPSGARRVVGRVTPLKIPPKR
jgi:hypothetical protein